MRAASLSLACLLLVLTACGGDDEDVGATQTTTSSTEQTAPATDLTAPATPAPARPAPAPAVPPPPDGGHDRETGGAPAPTTVPEPDSPENDRPPPPGSPAERFEKECDAKPELCG